MKSVQATEQRAVEYPATDWLRAVEEATRKLKGRPRHCGLNAIRHLKRAWQIALLDPETAFFKAITAEEEAATGLMVALKQQRYPGADKLQPRSHTHKAGWKPLLGAVQGFMAACGVPAPTYQLQYEGKRPRLDVHLPAAKLGFEGDYALTPDEPLNLMITEGAGIGAKIVTFEKELHELATQRGAATFLKMISDEANLRNRLLYASDDGIAVVEGVDHELIARGRAVSLLMTLTVVILQTKAHQHLAVQVLEAYLKILGQLPESTYNYEAALAAHAPQ